ncbi:MAG TPA: type II toxin-antitoxin system prevent-host-death family antitoxin [Longimicrobium sp.]|nr:type II toxin-antitoxin system prevent-host-death family antitoxin [Longimicrobium sp.]
MQIVNVHAAKTNLSRLIERACAGEDIVIARNSEPAVRLVPVRSEQPRRQRGSLEGQVIVPDSFFDPLPPEELEAWHQ